MDDNYYPHEYKYTMYPMGNKNNINKAYKIIRKAIANNSLEMNICTAVRYVLNSDYVDKDFKEGLENVLGREPNSKLDKIYSDDISPVTGLNMASAVSRRTKTDIKNDKKNDKHRPRYYKDSSPFSIRKKFVTPSNKNSHGLYHEYTTDEEFIEKLEKSSECELFLNFVDDITFKLDLGTNPYKSRYIRGAIKKIYQGVYLVCDSKISLKERKDGNGDDIILSLIVGIPKENNHELKEDVVCGIDVGVAVPLCCALNNDLYEKRLIGYGQQLIDYDTKIKAEIKRKQQMAKYVKGGHGRKRKTRNVYAARNKRKHFHEEMCRKFAKEAVKFAYNNHAKYINMENLTGISERKRILKDLEWPFYMLQQMVEYEAGKYGIIVRYVDPEYTSQTCSICGSLEEKQRNGRSFCCINSKCKSHKLYTNKQGEEFFHADFNAARNIAKSTDFVEKGKKGMKNKKKKSNQKSISITETL